MSIKGSFLAEHCGTESGSVPSVRQTFGFG